MDVLVHNAGVLPDRGVETASGLELTFATHVAGPLLLTARLAPALLRVEASRVVFVSSGGMYSQRLQLDDPQWHARSLAWLAAASPPPPGGVFYFDRRRVSAHWLPRTRVSAAEERAFWELAHRAAGSQPPAL